MTTLLSAWIRSVFSTNRPSRPSAGSSAPGAPTSEPPGRSKTRTPAPSASDLERDRAATDDLYAMRDDEFERYVSVDRARDAQHEPTTTSLPRSRVLSRESEAEVVRVDSAGLPNLHLVCLNGQMAVAVPDGRLIDPKSISIHRHDLFLIGVRGRSYHQAANLSVDTKAGTRLELLREPDNEHDPNAVAVVAPQTGDRLGYVNKLNAKRLAKRLDAGEELAVLSLRGSPEGKDGDLLMVLVTRPEILAHLQRPISPAAQSESVREERVETDPDVLAEDRWKAGTPPVHGLAKQAEKSREVANVRTGQELRVELVGKRWLVYGTAGGVLGQLRWRPADNGKVDPRFGTPIAYPTRGVLHVTRLRKEGGRVVDFGGYVTPE